MTNDSVPLIFQTGTFTYSAFYSAPKALLHLQPALHSNLRKAFFPNVGLGLSVKQSPKETMNRLLETVIFIWRSLVILNLLLNHYPTVSAWMTVIHPFWPPGAECPISVVIVRQWAASNTTVINVLLTPASVLSVTRRVTFPTSALAILRARSSLISVLDIASQRLSLQVVEWQPPTLRKVSKLLTPLDISIIGCRSYLWWYYTKPNNCSKGRHSIHGET